MKNNQAKLVVIPTDWGHMCARFLAPRVYDLLIHSLAGGPECEDDIKFIATQIQEFFKST